MQQIKTNWALLTVKWKCQQDPNKSGPIKYPAENGLPVVRACEKHKPGKTNEQKIFSWPSQLSSS